MHAEDGSLYVLGHCHLAGAERRFRVDRIAMADAPRRPLRAAGRHCAGRVFQPDADDPRVELELDPSAAWVAEAYPVEEVETRPTARCAVRLAVAAEAWFERLLVGLGPQARVVDAPASLRDAGRRASERILDRYR